LTFFAVPSSPYRTAGVYIGGANRGCSQPNLTPSWVRKQVADGWGLIRASNTQPVLVLRFEAATAAALAAYRAEVEGWLAAESDRA